MKQLETLEAWKCAERLARDAYQLTLATGLRSHFGLADQIRRAAVSIPANMAEGYALGTTQQFIRCLRIALGSTAELHSHLRIARDIHLLGVADSEPLITLCERVLKLTLGLLRRLETRRGRSPFPIPHSPPLPSGQHREPS